MKDFYTQLLSERQSWIPVPLPLEPFKSEEYGVPEVVERALALSVLEMPVGQYIGEATKKELSLPKSAIALLKSNIKDESIHDRQFQLAMQSYPVRERLKIEAEAIAQEWNQHPDHTLSKAKELETAILLITQSIIRFFGGQSLDRMASDISQDEWRHLQTNWSVCEELSLQSSPSLLRLATETLDWVVSGLSYPKTDANFWHQQSKIMVEDGEAPEMESLFNWTPRIAFFEVENSRISFYG